MNRYRYGEGKWRSTQSHAGITEVEKDPLQQRSRRQAILRASLAVACLLGSACDGSSGADRDTEVVRSAVTSPNDIVLAMESPSKWSTTTSGAVLGQSTTHTEGSFSLSVRPSNSNGNTPLKSVSLSTLTVVSPTLAVDVFLPTFQPNPNWYGTLQVGLNCPSRNIFSQFLAQVELTGKTLNAWNTITFPLPNSLITSLLQAGYTDLTLTVSLNVQVPTSGTYFVDNLRFIPLASNACGGRPNGTSCTDTNACTVADTCQSGACRPGPTTTCPADQCHVGVCNTTSGLCSTTTKPNNSSCDDGDKCTQLDTCQSGTCTGANPKTCTASDQCHDVGTCVPATGVCTTPAKVNGVACNDSNACTLGDTCQTGICTGTQKSCPGADQCNLAGLCDTASGACGAPIPKPQGTLCSDGLNCTDNTKDACNGSGACVGGPLPACPAPDACHAAGACSETDVACHYPNVADFTTCDGADPTKMCVVGTCQVDTKFLVKVRDWKDQPYAGALITVVDSAGADKYTVLSDSNGEGYVPLSYMLTYGYDKLRAKAAGGVAKVTSCAPDNPIAPREYCTIVVGVPVKVTVKKASNPVAGAEISYARHMVQPDGNNISYGVFGAPAAVTDASGTATVLVLPGKSPNGNGTPTYPYVYQFRTVEPGVSASYFAEHTCPATSCDCDVSECLVGGSADDCSEGTINIASLDPTLPTVRNAGIDITGNAFIKEAAKLVTGLATDPAGFSQVMRTSFNKDTDAALFDAKVEQLRNEILAGNFGHVLPEANVYVRKNNFGDHMAAYSKTTKKIYISSQFTGDNSRSTVYQTEFGHFIADFLRDGTVLAGKNADAPGQESDIFYLLATGVDLSSDALAGLQKSDDHGTLKYLNIPVRFGLFSWIGDIGSFITDGWEFVEDLGTKVGTTIWNGGKAIGGFVYDSAKSAGGILATIIKAATDLPKYVIDKLNELVKSGYMHTLNRFVSELTYGVVDLEDLLTPLNIIEGVVTDVGDGINKVTNSLGQIAEAIATGDESALENAVANLGVGLVQTGFGTIEDAVVNVVTDALVIVDGIFTPPARMLSKDELNKVRPVFCGGVNFSEVRMKSAGPLWGLINLARKDVNGDPRAITLDDDIYLFGVPDPDYDTLVHEMTHVWQYQHGGPIYKSIAIDYQIAGSAYDWQPDFDGNPTLMWVDLNPEQQAQFVQDAFFSAKFWPNKNQCLMGGGDYTARAKIMATDLTRGIGAPSVLNFPL